MRIVSIVGARPQFIKASVVSKALRAVPGLDEVLVHTGQHFDDNMSAVFFSELDIPEPAYNLGVGSGTHGLQTGRQLIEIEKVLLREKPAWVLVYGDTNSTIAGALAAAKLNIPVAHVEAGLRSFRRDMPEEVNRILTDHCSSLLFAPTDLAVENLRREGISGRHVHSVGDVMYDVVLQAAARVQTGSSIVQQLNLPSRHFVLATIHRAANTDDPARLRTILEGFGLVAREMPVVFPIHPRTRQRLDSISAFNFQLSAFPGLQLIEPLGYLDMVALETEAAVVATDSGGVQKEAFFHETPCVTLREQTEWQELVESGWNRLCPPTSAEAIRDTILAAIGTRGSDIKPYGDGKASEKIAAVLSGSETVTRRTDDGGRRTEDGGRNVGNQKANRE